MASRTCQQCGTALDAFARADARTCSARCRVAANRQLPPAVMRARPRWVRHSAAKVPLQAGNGWPASSTNADTWAPWRIAATSSHGVGVGFVLNGDGIVCVDLDGCLDSRGRLVSWAVPVLDGVPATYVEVSMSGRGLHVFGFGRVERGRRAGPVEVYGSGRFIAMTGRRWRGAPSSLADCGEWVEGLGWV